MSSESSTVATERIANRGFSFNRGINDLESIDEFTSLEEEQKQQKKKDTLCSRFMEDISGPCLCLPSFRAVDGISRFIDIPASFSPQGFFPIAGKIVMLGVVGGTLYYGLIVGDIRVFWLAYLTNWNVIVSSLYILISFFNTLVPVVGPPVFDQTIVNLRVRVT